MVSASITSWREEVMEGGMVCIPPGLAGYIAGQGQLHCFPLFAGIMPTLKSVFVLLFNKYKIGRRNGKIKLYILLDCGVTKVGEAASIRLVY